jgi:predicted CoA-binding protein
MPIVAVIGASTDRHKFGNKALRAFRAQGYTVIPINPNATTVEGERAYASVLDYPGPIDEVTLYVPPEIGVTVVEEVARKGVKSLWLNPGADGPEVIARARALGLSPTIACSILGVGETPGDY